MTQRESARRGVRCRQATQGEGIGRRSGRALGQSVACARPGTEHLENALTVATFPAAMFLDAHIAVGRTARREHWPGQGCTCPGAVRRVGMRPVHLERGVAALSQPKGRT